VRVVLLHPQPLQANLGRLGAVVGVGRLLEPRVGQGLLRRDAMLRIIHEDLSQEVEEVLEERGVVRDYVLSKVSRSSVVE
jgi:hypothetical protein